MMVRPALSNALTALLVVCALTVTAMVVHTARMVDSVPKTRHIAEWRTLVRDRAVALGKKTATIHIIEFSDYQCPYCGDLEKRLVNIVEANPDSVNVVRYNLPLTSIHPYAMSAAISAECAGNQGVLEQYQSLLFEHAEDLGKVSWVSLAKKASVPNLDIFAKCVEQRQSADRVRADGEVGKRLGIHVTPTLIVNGELIEGAPPPEFLKDVISRAAAGARSKGSLLARIERFF